MSKLPKNKEIIEAGRRLGRLVVVELVKRASSHDLFEETSLGYLRQGRLWEIQCDCGTRRLISESALSTGRIKSCGCLRRQIRENSNYARVRKLTLSAAKANNARQIRIEQARLRALKFAPASRENNEAIRLCAEKIRGLFAEREELTKTKKSV